MPLCLVFLSSMGVAAQGGEQVACATISLTGFAVTDSMVEIQFRIKNDSDHDVWVCESVDAVGGTYFEVHLSEEPGTLIVRRRFEVPQEICWDSIPDARYVRLRPGEARSEVVTLAVPIESVVAFTEGRGIDGMENVRRLILEVGFYDEDLPELIRGILEEAEKCAEVADYENWDRDIVQRYFPGLLVRRYIGPLSFFNARNEDQIGEGRVIVPYHWQTLGGEQVLRIKMDGLDILYNG